MIRFPTLDEALELQRRLLARFGGTPGVRDLGLLDSALHRPQTGYYESLHERAAALLDSLLLNHPFLDGNKRTAFLLADVFLRMNGYRIRIDAARAHRFILAYLAAGDRKLDDLSEWIRSNLRKGP